MMDSTQPITLTPFSDSQVEVVAHQSPFIYQHRTTSRRISLPQQTSPTAILRVETSPELSLIVQAPGRTLDSRRYDSVTVRPIDRRTQVGEWFLRESLLVELRPIRRQRLATTWLE